MQLFDNISEDNLQLLDQKRERLNQIRNDKLEGVMLPSRARYEKKNVKRKVEGVPKSQAAALLRDQEEDLGEKPTNYSKKEIILVNLYQD